MLKKLDSETKLGGLFGVIALIAIVVEMAFNDFCPEAISGGIKDIAGTLVSVMVLVVAIKSFIKNSPKNLREELNVKLEEFEEKYVPLIFKVQDFKMAKEGNYTQGFSILQDLSKYPELSGTLNKGTDTYNNYASYTSRSTGKFVDLPNFEKMLSDEDRYFKIEFSFVGSNEYSDEYKATIRNAIERKFSYHANKNANKFTVEVPCFKTKDDIYKFISLLEFVVMLYQIGNKGIKVKQVNEN